MHIQLTKTLSGLIPADPKTDAWYQKIKLAANVHGDIKLMRNAAFHRKLFALFNLSFDYWEPGEINSKYGVPEKNFDRFRKDLTILAGHYHIVIRLDGTTRIEADSLAFGSVDQETFNNLYSNILDAILKSIPKMNEWGEEKVNETVEKVLEFA